MQFTVDKADLPNWAEAAVAISGLAGPVLVVTIGWLVNRRLKEIDVRLARTRDLMCRRFQHFDAMSEWINDIFCYSSYVGHWRSMTPVDILQAKRRLDKLIYANVPIWGSEFLVAYRRFIRACFREYTGVDGAAQLKTSMVRHKKAWGARWLVDWDQYFAMGEGAVNGGAEGTSFTRPSSRGGIQLVSGYWRKWDKRVRPGRVGDETVSFREDVVQPAYAELLATIAAKLGVAVSRQEILSSWQDSLPRISPSVTSCDCLPATEFPGQCAGEDESAETQQGSP